MTKSTYRTSLVAPDIAYTLYWSGLWVSVFRDGMYLTQDFDAIHSIFGGARLRNPNIITFHEAIANGRNQSAVRA